MKINESGDIMNKKQIIQISMLSVHGIILLCSIINIVRCILQHKLSDKKLALKSNLAYTKNGRFLDKLFTINHIIKVESKNAKIMENTYRFDY